MGRKWRAVVAAVVGVVATTALSVMVNLATSDPSGRIPLLERHPWRWLVACAAAAVGAALLDRWMQRLHERSLRALVPASQRTESWVVERPAQVDEIVRALRRGGSVGITTAVQGAGGFGKTTVARMVRADSRVLRRFGRRVYWVTLGRDVRRGALVEKVNELVRQIDPERSQQFTDERLAAEHLAAVLAAGPRRLVILDDVWFEDQLAAFPVANRSARLVTTRMQSLVAGRSVPVKVDQMSDEQARRLITHGLRPVPPPAVVHGLVTACGRWPLLLRLLNKAIAEQCRSRTDVGSVAMELLQRLRRDGPMGVGRLTGGSEHFDIDDPDQRARAVDATLEASMGLLSESERARFAELAIFVDDEAVPVSLVSMMGSAPAHSTTSPAAACALALTTWPC